MHYVYELRDNKEVVWVGETIRPDGRLWQHTSNTGKFTGQDLDMTVVAEYNTRKEAWYHQVRLQEEYGLESDLSKTRRAGKQMTDTRRQHLKNIQSFETSQKGGLNNKGNKYTILTRTCPHCDLTGKGSNMTRYHFDNCKWKQ